jgi:hypothetical protein
VSDEARSITAAVPLMASTPIPFVAWRSSWLVSESPLPCRAPSLLITVVVLSAIVPTAIAQWRYAPSVDEDRSAARPPIGGALPAGEQI